MLITDCHVHIQPYHKFLSAEDQEHLKRNRPHDFELIMEFGRSPACFLKYLDELGIGRAALINSVPPRFFHLLPQLNELAAEYAQADERRLISCAGIDPLKPEGIDERIAQIFRLKLRQIKLHPPHQYFYPNDYQNGLQALGRLYGMAQEAGVPVVIHTGTSIFPFARSKYGDPMPIDDVAVDFPKLKIVVAHGGRPLWMDTAFFLVRRHRNVYMDVSSIPPSSLLDYFPRLEKIADKVMYGSDWPGPGVPGLKDDLDAFRALPLSEAAREAILCNTALKVWPEKN